MQNALIKLAVALAAFSAVAVARPSPILENDVADASNVEYRLIETAPDERRWMTESEIMELIIKDQGFMDVTDSKNLNAFVAGDAAPVRSKVAIPTALKRTSAVRSYLTQLSKANLESYLTKLTSFQNRYYTSTFGVQSAQFIFDTVSGFAQGNPLASVRKFDNTWSQFSVIARIEGKVTDSDIVILGAHQDSISSSGTPTTNRAPGADDDGSGTVSLMEIFRVLASDKNFKPDLPIEFHFYSAEEVGLRGSQAIATAYDAAGITVRGMMQTDMTGYNGKESAVGIVTDYTTADLNKFLRTLVDNYCGISWKDTTCGYACSDHGSWTKLGYPGSFPFEAQFKNKSPYIHSAKDDLTTVSYDHMLQFANLGVSFAVEMSTL